VAYGADSSANFRPIYELDDRIDVKIEKIATRIYGADGVVFQPRAQHTSTSTSRVGPSGSSDRLVHD
jgi:formyltetrahydrofolate synthetase